MEVPDVGKNASFPADSDLRSIEGGMSDADNFPLGSEHQGGADNESESLRGFADTGGSDDADGADLSSSVQLDELIKKLTPLFTVNDHLFDDQSGSSPGEGNCSSSVPPPSSSLDDDDMKFEERRLGEVERKIQEELEDLNASFRMALETSADGGLTSLDTETAQIEIAEEEDLPCPAPSPVRPLQSPAPPRAPPPAAPKSSNPLSPEPLSPEPLDSSLIKKMRQNSRKDMKKASDLLKGTEDLKRQLEELSSLATWNEQGDIVIKTPPRPPPQTVSLNRSISDNRLVPLLFHCCLLTSTSSFATAAGVGNRPQ